MGGYEDIIVRQIMKHNGTLWLVQKKKNREKEAQKQLPVNISAAMWDPCVHYVSVCRIKGQ